MNQGTMRETGVNSSISARLPTDLAAEMDSKMTIGRPTMMADMRKSSGSSGVHHNGLTFVGAISMSEPSEDWCMQESRTPRMMKIGSTRQTTTCATRSGRCKRRMNRPMRLSSATRSRAPSSSAGAISMVRTVR